MIFLTKWEETTFSDAIEINPKRELKKGIECKFVSMDNLQEHNKTIHNFDVRKFSGGSKFMNKDTLMARITPCLENGKTAFVNILDEGEVAGGSTEFNVLSAREGKTIPEFVYYLSITPEIRGAVIKSMTGTSGRQRVDSGVFETIMISLPPATEQKAISKILSDLDSKIELNNQMNTTLESMAQAIFKHWFIDFEFPNENGKPYKSSRGKMVDSEFGKIPEGWKYSKIGKELKTVLGGTPPTQNKTFWEDGTIPWINSGKINEFRITEPTAYITEDAINNSATKLMPNGTTVLAITGATLGQVSMTVIDTCANQSVIGVLSSSKIPSEYIYFWIKMNIKDIISNQTGGAQQHINKTNIEDFRLLIPSKETIEDFIAIVRQNFATIANNCFESISLTKTRDALLPKLMSGKIRVQMVISK